MRCVARLERYRRMPPAEKARELHVLEAAARTVWAALPDDERARRRALIRRRRLRAHARLCTGLAAAARQAARP